MKYFISTVIIIVILVIGAGLWVAGSPAQERMRRFDETRTMDLQNIQSQIVSYWQAKNTLPNELPDLRDGLGGQYLPADPETKASYEYEKVSDTAFRLCANFATTVNTTDNPYGYGGKYPRAIAPYPSDGPIKGSWDWSHGSGRVCFDRTIDKDYFKTVQPVPGIKD